jgi:hypothetical protein
VVSEPASVLFCLALKFVESIIFVNRSCCSRIFEKAYGYYFKYVICSKWNKVCLKSCMEIAVEQNFCSFHIFWKVTQRLKNMKFTVVPLWALPNDQQPTVFTIKPLPWNWKPTIFVEGRSLFTIQHWYGPPEYPKAPALFVAGVVPCKERPSGLSPSPGLAAFTGRLVLCQWQPRGVTSGLPRPLHTVAARPGPFPFEERPLPTVSSQRRYWQPADLGQTATWVAVSAEQRPFRGCCMRWQCWGWPVLRRRRKMAGVHGIKKKKKKKGADAKFCGSKSGFSGFMNRVGF